MIIPVGVRTIDVDLQDQATCCSCISFRKNVTSGDTFMYVNTMGVAVKYDVTKALDMSLSVQKSLTNIRTVIEENFRRTHSEVVDELTQTTHDIRDIVVDFQTSTGLDFDRPESSPLTLNAISRVNSAILQLFP